MAAAYFIFWEKINVFMKIENGVGFLFFHYSTPKLGNSIRKDRTAGRKMVTSFNNSYLVL